MALDLRWHESARTLLRDLIRIDTSNPPGNELRACELLAEALAEGGVEPKIHRVAPERGNLVARLKGEDARLPPLLLSAHLDVVPADPVGWTHPPFAAEEADGCIWGRGAIDMKHMAAMAATVLLRMKAEAVGLRRDVILACVADEEVGGALGAQWLVDNAPDDVRAGVALGEIGGMSLRLAGRRVYPVQVAEKGLAWLRLTARGAAGHGSVPDRSSAVVKLARAVEILGRTPLPTRMTPAARA
ncbi:MAG: M20/M25/M40 family metallo-hydrolase, partial [Myxococcota bacterium]|nr:M20/M25/M40 family metallo-hydrolase [Myxococcota bacterium]